MTQVLQSGVVGGMQGNTADIVRMYVSFALSRGFGRLHERLYGAASADETGEDSERRSRASCKPAARYLR